METAAVRRRRGVLAACLAVSAALLLAGCSDGARIREAQQSPLPLSGTWRAGLFVQGYGPQGLAPSTTVSPSASTSADPTLGDPLQRTLAPLGLVQADFTNGFHVDVVAKGTSLMEKTLAFCGKDYPSEEAREARRRTVLVGPKGELPGVLTEAVLYTTPKSAAAALAELRAAARACDPAVPLESNGAKVTVAQTGTDGVDVAGFVPPGDRVLIASTLTTSATAASASFLTAYQVRGRVLVALYFQHGDGSVFTAQDVRDFHLLGASIATRLNALETAVVNGA